VWVATYDFGELTPQQSSTRFYGRLTRDSTLG
jgi:hypothetical protein